MRLSLDDVNVFAAGQYPIAGVYGFGRGLFKRSPISGSETSYKTLHRLHVGQLVMSRLKAFEGAVAVVPEALDGWYVSPEFPTFECDEGELDLAYLGHLCRWPEFWSMLRRSSRGIGARRERVHSDDLLRLELDVPSVDEQRRAAARLSRSAERIRAVVEVMANTERLRGSFVPSARRYVLSNADFPSRLLKDVAELEMGQSPPGGAYNEFGEGMPLLNGPTEFGEEHPCPRQWTTVVTKVAEPGDLLICVRGATTGRMNWADRRYCVGRGLAAIRPQPELLHSKFLRHVLLHLAPEIMSRTAGSTFANLPGSRLARLPLPIPDLSVQHQLGSDLSDIEERDRRMSELARQSKVIVGALQLSLLNEAFAGLS